MIGLAAATQLVEDVAILRQQTVTCVDHEYEHVGFFDRQAHLLGGHTSIASSTPDKPPVSTTTNGSFATAADTVVAITGDAWHVSDQGVTAARQYIEEGRFTDIGTTD
jgi:hypothetical protein